MRRPSVLLVGLASMALACSDTTPSSTPTSPTVATTESLLADPAPPGSPSSSSLSPSTPPPSTPSPWPAALDATHQRWTISVLERIPHDPTAFTQGLEMSDRGLLEGTGRRAQSTIRLVDPVSGAEIERRDLDPSLFGEGLTVVGDEIIQLTWTAGRALRYESSTLAPVGEFSYTGEAWGICAGLSDIWMSDGTPDLQRRDPSTFALLDTVTVRREGVPVDDLNELECIDDHVVANVWKSDEILVIEPGTGEVVATIDATALTAEVGPTDAQAVLNGIADLGDGTLLLTGKLWPTMFVVTVELAA